MDTRKIVSNASYFYNIPLIDSVKRLEDTGFKKIEFTGLSLKKLSSFELSQLAGFMRGEGLVCSAVNAASDLIPVNLGNLAAVQEKERRNAIAHVKQCIDFAAFLQSKRVVCDIGISTEDFLTLDKQNGIFLLSVLEVLKYAKASNISIVLINIPGRRWVAWEGLPPDKVKVVERHVWPWRIWPDEKEMVKTIGKKLKGQVTWAFDTANEMVASGVTKFKLIDIIPFYMKHGLEIVYLANHPGPYNKAWHRLLLHQPLWDGFYTGRDYRLFLDLLKKSKFSGEIVLQIREKEPTEYSLKRSLDILGGR